jgi:hypothetical protein
VTQLVVLISFKHGIGTRMSNQEVVLCWNQFPARSFVQLALGS